MIHTDTRATVEEMKASIGTALSAALSLAGQESLKVTGLLWDAGFRPGRGKGVVKWTRTSKNGFEQNVVLSWAHKGVSVRAFARKEMPNGVWRRQVTNPKAVSTTEVNRLLERTIFGFDDLERTEMKSGVGARAASYPEMHGEDVYRYLLHGKSKEWVADRYGVGAKAVSNAARNVESQVQAAGRNFKILAGADEANTKLLETYFALGVIAERRRMENAYAERLHGELDGLSSSTLSRCKGMGIETAEGLFGWLISGRLARTEFIGPKTVEEVAEWLEDRGFPVRTWADANGAILDERKLADAAMARQRSIIQGAVEDVVRAATKMVIQLGLERIIESEEVAEFGESGSVLKGQLWVRKPAKQENG